MCTSKARVSLWVGRPPEELSLAHGWRRFVPHLVREVGVGGHDVDLGTGLLELFVAVGSVFDFSGQLKVKAAGMKISTDHLPFRDSSETVMNSPLPPRFTKASVLKGWTCVLIRDMSGSCWVKLALKTG